MTLISAKAFPQFGDVSRHHTTDQTDHTAGHDADQFAATNDLQAWDSGPYRSTTHGRKILMISATQPKELTMLPNPVRHQAQSPDIDAQICHRPGWERQSTMPICDTCGNDYDKAFTVTREDGRTATFDSIECAAVGLAPACAHAEGRWFDPSRDHKHQCR